jgi:hypothetical protein
VGTTANHPLAEFVYSTFGKPFGELLMVGYGVQTPPERRSFTFTERYDGGETGWVMDVTSSRPLRGQEPLVLAAVLKLMLGRPGMSQTFEFEMEDLLDELDWAHTRRNERAADRILEKCVYVNFHKYEREGMRERYEKANTEWGRYKLISGHVMGRMREPGEPSSGRVKHRVDFDGEFTRGLAEGRVLFAGLDFGVLHPSNDTVSR